MTISQRAEVEGVVCDVVCTGRFYDFLEKRKGRWGLVLRRLTYEKDRLDPVDPAAKLVARPANCWRTFPRATATSPICRRKIGYKVKPTCPASTARSSTRSTPRARPG